MKTCSRAVHNLTSLARTLLSGTTGSESTAGSVEYIGSSFRACIGGDVARKPLASDIHVDNTNTAKVLVFQGAIVALQLGLPVEQQSKYVDTKMLNESFPQNALLPKVLISYFCSGPEGPELEG